MCCGYMANPMMQPRASMLPLASIAAWCTGGDPSAAWDAAATELGWRAFAEACDGAVPQQLVRALIEEGDGPGWVGAADDLESWLNASSELHGPRTRVRRRTVARAGSRGGCARAASPDLGPQRPDRGSRSARTARPAPPCPTPLESCGTRSRSRLSGRSCGARSPPCSAPRLGVRPALAQHSEWRVAVARRRHRGGHQRDRRPRAPRVGQRRAHRRRDSARRVRRRRRDGARSRGHVSGGVGLRRPGAMWRRGDARAGALNVSALNVRGQSPVRGSSAAWKNPRTCTARSSSASGSSGSRSINPSRNGRSLK